MSLRLLSFSNKVSNISHLHPQQDFTKPLSKRFSHLFIAYKLIIDDLSINVYIWLAYLFAPDV